MSALLLLIPVAMFVAFLITFVAITRCLRDGLVELTLASQAQQARADAQAAEVARMARRAS